MRYRDVHTRLRHLSQPAESEYRSLVRKLAERCDRLIAFLPPPEFEQGLGLNVNFRELNQHMQAPADVIITSPPFPGMRFDRPELDASLVLWLECVRFSCNEP